MAFFSPKLRLFVNGRKNTFSELSQKIAKDDAVIWVHTASLGEFEQGLPIIEQLKTEFPSYKILVTFFSPSGYEIKKDTPVADMVTYLPIDTKHNANQFIKLAKPKLAVFIKYEIWPNYLRVLEKQNIPTVLAAAIFNKNQIFFRAYGGFMRKALNRFTHIFVQNKSSLALLGSINIRKASLTGDTRLDRVSEISIRNNTLEFAATFKNDQRCIVAGSTWPEDETILINYINQSKGVVKYIIAPHTIKKEKIIALKNSINKKTILHSEIKNKDPKNYDVLIIDTIGLLTKIYSYADIAYVGGGFATGLHNTLEPAVFGIPVLIGPNYFGFKEAEDLVTQGGILAVENAQQFDEVLNDLVHASDRRQKMGAINSAYITENRGASIRIIAHIRTLL